MYNYKKHPLQIGVCVSRTTKASKVYNLGKLVLDAYNVEQTNDEFGKLRTEVDHIDRDPFNNRLDNLRWATRRENALNRTYYGDKISKATKDLKWITDGHINSRIHVSKPLPLGFRYGRTNHKYVKAEETN